MSEDLLNEIYFKTSRSKGPGGQNVNKVESRVDLIFDVEGSKILTDEQKETIFRKLKNRISNDNLLHMQCDETRSQLKNKEIVSERFLELIKKAFHDNKKRIPTKPGKVSKEKRLKQKKKISEKKEFRKPVSGSES